MLAMETSLNRTELMQYALKLSMIVLSAYVTAKIALKYADPTKSQKESRSLIAREKLSKLKKSPKNMSEHELMIASHLVIPEEISVSFSDIGGLENVIQEIKETVIFPIKRKDLFKNSKLTQPPKGVLLYGPPGCGKTLLAKATARQAGTCFINLDLSLMTDKWYGESQKLTSAVFSLANKLQPCIIFIDEIDSFLRSRNTQDHEATAMMKAQFMTLWDGLVSESDCTVIVMGATNRPNDLDSAILRRMPATFKISLPSVAQREAIFNLILKNEPTRNLDFNKLAADSDGLSGSDIKEVCRIASTYRIREYFQQHPAAGDGVEERGSLLEKKEKINEEEMRRISMNDLEKAMTALKRTQVLRLTDDSADS